MSTQARTPTAAARTLTAGRQASAGRRPKSTPAEQLDDQSYRLDNLIRDVRLGAHSHRQLEDFIEEAEAIAAGIRAAFRGGAVPQHPPLWQRGGRAAW